MLSLEKTVFVIEFVFKNGDKYMEYVRQAFKK
jgi:hypothetical protein